MKRKSCSIVLIVFLLQACLVLCPTLHAEAVLQPIYSFGVSPPTGSLIQGSDGNLYGTIPSGGAYGFSAVFRLSTNGAFNLVYSLTNATDGNWPAGLVQGADGNLYGTTPLGGLSDNGSIFRLTTNGQFSTVYSFTGADDGAIPSDRLAQGSDGVLYGTTETTVFRFTPNGTLRTLYTFSGGNDGSNPNGALVFARDGNLYGTTALGGSGSGGTVFRITPDGSLNTLYSYIQGGPQGSSPVDCLLEGSDGAIYGATFDGCGTIFRISTNGMFKTVYDFCSRSDGTGPIALVQAHDGNLCGITQSGTFFEITYEGALKTLHSLPAGPYDSSFEWPRSPGLVQAKDGNFYTYLPTTAGLNSHGAVIRITSSVTTTEVHSFAGFDGGCPFTSLLPASDGNLYGTTSGLYVGAYGTIFRLATDGILTTLHAFSGGTDGAQPTGLVQASDGSFYGTTADSGYDTNTGYLTSYGTVFRMTTNGLFTTVYSFTGGKDGSWPRGGLVHANDGFYGTTMEGGSHTNQYGSSLGTVFYIGTNGTLSTIYSFQGGSDGAGPVGTLVLAHDGNLYGTTWGDGVITTNATVFRLSTNGALTTLYSFPAPNDILHPADGLLLADDGNLYGTTPNGGANSMGSVYCLGTNGIVTTLYSFTGGQDGSNLSGRLIQAGDGNLYGTAAGIWGWGSLTYGTVFRITTKGSLTTLFSFSGGHWTGGNGGSNPYAGLVQTLDGSLYGTTAFGGAINAGTVFRIMLTAPVLHSSSPSADSLSFSFQTSVGHTYTLEQNTNLATPYWAPYTNVSGDGSVFQCIVQIQGSPMRFFRVHEQ